MKMLDANVMCLSETQTAWENNGIREAILKEFRRGDKYTTITGSTSNTTSYSVVKPGGTAIISDGDWSNKTIKRGQDPSGMGRWSFITIEGKKHSRIMIICGYRCCKGQTINTVGPLTSYAQQYYMLKNKGTKKPNPQKQFIKDIKKFITEAMLSSHEILLCLDANETWQTPNSKIKEMADSLGLIDLVAKKLSPTPPTYTRKGVSNRVDFILGSKKVAECLHDVQMEPESLSGNCGDHHGMIIQMHIGSLLNLKEQDLMGPTSRKLKSNDVKGVEKYVEKLEKGIEEHNIAERMKTLITEIQGKPTLSEYHKKIYEGLDEDMFRLCINAERQIRRGKTGKFMWSPSLDKAHRIANYWRNRKKAFGNVHETGIVMISKKNLDIQDLSTLSLDQVESLLKEAYVRLHKVQKNDKEYRVQYLIDMADQYAANNNISRSTAIRELLVHEELRDIYSKIGAKMKTKRSPQMSEVWIQGETEEEKTIYEDSESVETHLLKRNFNHLQQAKDTPFACGSKQKYLGNHGQSNFTERILKREYLPEINDVDPIIRRYIESLAYSNPDIPDSVDVTITLDQYRQFWKNKKEVTVTSPFGLHIGHFKSVLKHDLILEIHMQLMMIPFQYSYAPKRWLSTVQVMLEKNPGTPWSHRLRIIELFDSQMNAAMQIFFGKRLIFNALKHNEIHESAFGSVPKRNAQDALLEKTLTFHMLILTRSDGAVFDCDAKGCYDRIIPKLVTIHSQRLGMPGSWAQFFSIYWSDCVHYVKTRYGISRKHYKADESHPLFGIGQGNGAGPATWLSHSIVMFQVLSDINDGIIFFSPNGEARFKSPGTGFVDDVTLGVTADMEDNEDVREDNLVKNINQIATYWEKMLYTNGGRLELKKCFWILVSWRWKQGKPVMKNIEDTKANITIQQSESKEEVIITRKEVTDAPKVLGCMIQADGKWNTEKNRWEKQALEFAIKVKQGRFDRRCGSKLYPTYWISKFRYVASIVGLEKKFCDDVEKPVVASCLSAAGYNMRFPRAVVFGSIAYGGMGWDSLFNVMLYEKVKILVKNIRKNTRLGNILRIAIETTQLHAGISDEVLNTQIEWYRWCPNTWITHLLVNMKLIGGAIQTSFDRNKHVRKHDRHLMDVFYEWNLSTTELDNLNTCRIYLQVITVADIASMEGNEIQDGCMVCNKMRESNLKWPNQCVPTKKMKSTWNAAMHRLCSVGNNLLRPLGPWKSVSHQIWKYMIEEEEGRLLRYDGQAQWAHYNTDTNIYTRRSHEESPIKSGIPVKVLITPIGYKISSIEHIDIKKHLCDDDITSALRWAKTSVGHLTCKDRRKFATSWKSGSNILVGTDGGLKDNIGTTGVVMEMEDDREVKLTATSAEICNAGTLHSTREELRAILSAEMIINQCGILWGNATERRITFICDSKSALSEVDVQKDKWSDRNFLGPESDLIMSIDALRRENESIHRVYQWEKAHQAQDECNENNEKRINREADALATDCRNNVEEGLMVPCRKQFMESSKVSLMINGTRITKSTQKEIHRAVHDTNLIEFLMTKYGWSDTTFNNIDWKSVEACLTKRPSIYLTAIMKLTHRWQPTLTKTSCYDKDSSNVSCSLCGQREVQHHYIYCQAEEFVMARKNEWLHLKNRIKQWKVHKDILQCMRVGMETWSNTKTIVRRPDLPNINNETNRAMSTMLTKAYDNQNDIGWNHFFLGRLSKEWKMCIRMCYDDDDIKSDGKADGCVRSIIENIWKMMLRLWKIRNDVEHGDNIMCSKRNIIILLEIVDELYGRFADIAVGDDKWMFEKEQKERKNDPVIKIATWVELVSTRFLGKEKNDDTKKELEGKIDKVLRRICLGTIYDT